jgi:hypothetical protein
LEIPVLREVLGLGEAFFVGADPPVFAGFVGGALPVTAIRASVNMDLSAHQCVAGFGFVHRVGTVPFGSFV